MQEERLLLAMGEEKIGCCEEQYGVYRMPVAHVGVRYIEDKRVEDEHGEQQPPARNFFTEGADTAPKAEQRHHEQKRRAHNHVRRMHPGIIGRAAPEVCDSFKSDGEKSFRMTPYEFHCQPALAGNVSNLSHALVVLQFGVIPDGMLYHHDQSISAGLVSQIQLFPKIAAQAEVVHGDVVSRNPGDTS